MTEYLQLKFSQTRYLPEILPKAVLCKIIYKYLGVIAKENDLKNERS